MLSPKNTPRKEKEESERGKRKRKEKEKREREKRKRKEKEEREIISLSLSLSPFLRKPLAGLPQRVLPLMVVILIQTCCKDVWA